MYVITDDKQQSVRRQSPQHDSFGTLAPATRRGEGRRPAITGSHGTATGFEATRLAMFAMLLAFPAVLVSLGLSVYAQPANAQAMAAARATDLASCRMQSRYLDARDQLRLDAWATTQCMERKGWDMPAISAAQ